MPKIEYHQPTPEDLGSEQSTAKGIERNPEVTADKHFENVIELMDSSTRESALADLKASWASEFRFDDIMDQDEVQVILFSPDNFIASLVNYAESLPAENYRSYLAKVASVVEKKIDALEAKRESLVERRIDYEQMREVALDMNLRNKIDRAIDFTDTYLTNGRKVLDYVQRQQAELLGKN